MLCDVDSDDFCKTFLSVSSRSNLDLAQKALKLFKNSNCQYKNDVFRIISRKSIFSQGGIGLSTDLEEFVPVLNTLEELEKSGQLDQVINVIAFFLQMQQYMHEKNINKSKQNQTQKANKKRFDKKLSVCAALKEYLIKVENLWHPPQTASSQQRNSRTNKQRAVEIVYKKNEQNITEILKSLEFTGDCEQEFSNCFDFFTKQCTERLGKTINGHIKEERAARSEESKKRTSETMKKKLQRTSSK